MIARGAALFAAILLWAPAAPAAELRVVTTTPSLADLARRVGGERVKASALMRGPESPHNVVPTPSFSMRLRKSDLFVHLGLDAEPWVPSLVRSARQRRLLPGSEANIDASRGISLLEVPAKGGLSRALGDIHVYGNPHYLLDPLNGVIVAGTLRDAFARADPAGAEDYRRNASALAERLRALTGRLVARLRPWLGRRVVVYHRSWPYFLHRFGLVEGGQVEPRPGIVPGPRHVSSLAARMRQEGMAVVVLETYSNRKVGRHLAQEAGGRAVVLAQEVNATPEAVDYPALFEHNVGVLADALGSGE